MRGLWLLWMRLPLEAQVLVAGAIVSTIVDAIRLFFPKIDGRWVHLLTLIVGGISGVLTAMASGLGASAPVVATLAIFAQATVTAIGLNEVKRGPKRLGKAREEANARKFVAEHQQARRNRRDEASEIVPAPTTVPKTAPTISKAPKAHADDVDGGAG